MFGWDGVRLGVERAPVMVFDGHVAPEICGDCPLTKGRRVRYLLRGLGEIGRAVRWRRRFEVLRFRVEVPEVQAEIAQGASAFRVYTCAIADRVASKYVPRGELVCDLGCGAGGHARFFERCGGETRYLGVDVIRFPSWASSGGAGGSRRLFIQTSIGDLCIAPERLAFAFSSSLLEHVARVESAVGEIARAMRPGAYGLHVVPSVWSLFLYLFHGYRRFSSADVAELFEGAGLEVLQIWALGGLASFALHWAWVTCPELLLGRLPWSWPSRTRTGAALRLYAGLLRVALRLDPWVPACPIGYAVLVRKPAG